MAAANPEALARLANSRAGQRLVRELGQMKGLAMKVGQMASYVDLLRELLRAVIEDDSDAIHVAVTALGIVRPGVRYARADARALLRHLYAPTLREGRLAITHEYTQRTTQRFLRSKNLFKLTMPGELLFLNRVNFGLLSIFVDLAAEIDWRGRSLDFLN